MARSKPTPDIPVEPGSFNEQLVALAGEFAVKTLELRELKEQEKALGREVDALSTQIIEMLELCELEPPLRLVGMGTVGLRTAYTVKQIDKDALKQSLEALGHGDLITVQVNTNSLGSLISELAKQNKQFPEGIEVSSFQKAVYTKPRAAKS